METSSKVKRWAEPSSFGAQKSKDYVSAVGRRREAVARVRLYTRGKGLITVNDKSAESYFPGNVAKNYYMRPFVVVDTVDKFDVTVRVVGGGPSGQLSSVVHGISRALEKLDREKYRIPLKKQGLLTRDSRTRERRMVGMGGKARRKKQSPKR